MVIVNGIMNLTCSFFPQSCQAKIVEKINLLLKEKILRVMLYAEGFARKLHGQGKQILKLLEE